MTKTKDVATYQDLHLSANFALGLIPECLRFLTEITVLPLAVKVSVHEQAIQHLSTIADGGRGSTAANDVVIVQISSWCGGARDGSAGQIDRLSGMTDLFLRAVEGAGSTGRSIIIAIAPEVTTLPQQIRTAIERCREKIVAATARWPTLRALDLQEAVVNYELSDISNRYASLDSLPYSEECQAAIAAWICRNLNLVAGQRCKAVVVDADNTLWRGECAGRQSVVLDAGSRRMQRALVACAERGMLVCICSKNEAEDVAHALSATDGMILRESHIAVIDTGWGPKSERLQRITSRLGIAQDSLLFIDDDGFECADVRFHCPNVVVVQAPADDDELRRLLTHLWPLDHVPATYEDLERTAWYRAQSQRESHNSGNLEQFLENIGLTVDIRPLADDDLPRIVQLSQRARQWNNDAQPWTVEQLQAEAGSGTSLVVRVSDRFSDYGIVGFCIAKQRDDVLQIPLLIMSCRALGKNVEYSLLHRLALVAGEKNCTSIEVPVRETSRNQVLRSALEVAGFRSAPAAGEQELRFHCELLHLSTHLEPRPFGFALVGVESSPVSVEVTSGKQGTAEIAETRARGLALIATHYNRAERLLSAMMARRDHADLEPNSNLLAPRTPTEAEVLNIWQSVLAILEIGMDEDFFDLQADSLRAVQILTRVKKRFGVELPLSMLFEKAFTIGTIAEAIDLATIGAADASLLAAELAKLHSLSDSEVTSRLTGPSRSGTHGGSR